MRPYLGHSNESFYHSSAEYFTTFSSGPEQIVDFEFDAGRIITAVVENVVSANGNPLIIRDPFANAFTQVGNFHHSMF